MTNSTVPYKIHDTFFKEMMHDIRVARDFLQAHLPKALLAVIELESLRLGFEAHIDTMRKEGIMDILYEVKIAGRESYISLIIEHLSEPDPLLPFYMLNYTCHVIKAHIEQHPKTKTIPLVYPLVVYHNKKPYPYTNDINNLVDAPEELVEEYFLKPFDLIDLT